MALVKFILVGPELPCAYLESETEVGTKTKALLQFFAPALFHDANYQSVVLPVFPEQYEDPKARSVIVQP